jgi:hypothetical protein
MGELRKRGVMSKIEKYDLIGHAINLLTVTPKMTYKEIAEELNSIGDVPEEERITAENVMQFVKSHPQVRREVLLDNRQHMRKMVLESAEFDMLGTLKDMAGRLTFMIDTMEQLALDEGTIPDPKGYKALSSELRETLKQIEGIHKEVYDMEVVREFLIEVIKTLKEVSPEALTAFIAKMKGKRDNNHIVSELLKGGL